MTRKKTKNEWIFDTLKTKASNLSVKIRHLKTRIKLQGANPDPVWKRDLKVAQKNLKVVQKTMLNYIV